MKSRTVAGCCDPVEEIVRELNRFLRGWAGYFRYGNSAQFFDKITLHVREPAVDLHRQPPPAVTDGSAGGSSPDQSPDRLG